MATLQERAQEALARILALDPGTPQYNAELDRINAEFRTIGPTDKGSINFAQLITGNGDATAATQAPLPSATPSGPPIPFRPPVGPTDVRSASTALRPPVAPLSGVERPLTGPAPTRALSPPGATRPLGPPSVTRPSTSLGALTLPTGNVGAERVSPELGQLAEASPIEVKLPQTPEEEQSLIKKWEGFLARDDVRAGLLQFAVNVLQPVGPGQSQVGAIARAAGGGLKAAGRVGAERREEETLRREEERKDRALDIKEKAVKATTEAARIRAGKTITKVATLADGTRVLRFFDPKGKEQISELPLGIDPASIKFNLAKIRFDLAQKKEGLSVQDPLVNSFTSRQAKSMLDSLGASSENILSALLGLGKGGGGGPSAPPTKEQLSAMSADQINALSNEQIAAIKDVPELRATLEARITELDRATPGEVPIF